MSVSALPLTLLNDWQKLGYLTACTHSFPIIRAN